MEAAVSSPPIRDYDGLVAALRARKEFLGMSDETLEHIAGLTPRHATKLLAASRAKNMGPFTFGLMLQALAINLAVVEDPEALKLIQNRIRRRDEKSVRRDSKQAQAAKHPRVPYINGRNARQLAALRALKSTPSKLEKWGRKGGKARAQKLSAKERKRIARKAACDRWKRRPRR